MKKACTAQEMGTSKFVILEQLECLRSEDTPTHTIDSYWIPSQKKRDKIKVTNLKN